MSFSTGNTNLEWTPSPDVEGVMIGVARKDGPTVGVLGGVHGDEPAGIEIAAAMPRDLSIKAGRVVVMMGNLKAIEAGTRQVNENLNRFFKPLDPVEALRADLPYEVKRAQDLMGHIDECEAILDIHEYEDPEGTPFIICERPSLDTALRIGSPVIAFGFAEAEPGGTDGYGYEQGIVALCAEIGPMVSKQVPRNVRLGKRMVNRFLAAHSLTDDRLRPLHNSPLLIEVDSDSPYKREGDTFEFADTFKSFQTLQRGQLIAIDGGRPIRASADEDQVIVFPKPVAPAIGREAFELGRVVTA